MREIKFRAWDGEKMNYCGLERIGGYHDMMGHQIMQFTGLRDRNGTEIYEGDVVEYKEYEYDDKSEVSRDVVTMSRFPVFWLEKEETGYEGECLVDHEYTKVIGNIHENPEIMR